MVRLRVFLSLLAFALLVLPSQSVAESTYEVVPIPLSFWAFANTSDDGSVTAINAGGEYFIVTEGGVESLGFGHEFSWSTGVAGNGSAIIGTMVDPDTGWRNPAIWRPGEDWSLLGPVPGGLQCDNSLGSGYAMNADGTSACGLAWSSQLCKAVGFLWTLEDGMVALDRDTQWSCRASDISGDGSTVVGFGDHPQNGQRGPVRWVDGGPIERFLGPDAAGECMGVNSDGSIICGTIDFGSGMIWTAADGLTVVPPPAGDLYFQDVADDGTVVGNYASTACLRFPADGIVLNLRNWLIANGAVIPADHILTNVTSISTDASTLVGTWTTNGNLIGVFIARIGPQTGVVADDDVAAAPPSLVLESVYPNPFNPTLNLRFSLGEGEHVTVSVFDAQGRLVKELLSGFVGAGQHDIAWDGVDERNQAVASGMYLVELRGESERQTAKAVLGK